MGAGARLRSGEPSRPCAPARRSETPGERGARFLCAARKTAGTPGAKPAPPERRAWVPFCTPWSASGSEKAKTSEASPRRLVWTLGWRGWVWNQAGEARLSPEGSSGQGTSSGVLEQVGHHLAPFKCASGCLCHSRCPPGSRPQGDQGWSVPKSHGVLSSRRIRTGAAPGTSRRRGRRN